MASNDSSASHNGVDKGKGKESNPVLPAEVQLQIIEGYVAKNYPILRLLTPADLKSTVNEVIIAAKDPQSWDGGMIEWDKDQFQWMVETAILSSSTIKLDITSRSQAQGSGPAQTVALIPSSMTELSKRVQHLALYISQPFPGYFIVDGSRYLRATAGMASLGQQLPHLKSLTLYLDIDTSGMTEVLARSGMWWTTRCTDGPPEAYGSPSSLTLKNIATLVKELLAEVKEHGPGRKKLFKLSVKHGHSRSGGQFAPGQVAHGGIWKFVCDEIDLSVEDVGSAAKRAWDSRKEETLD